MSFRKMIMFLSVCALSLCAYAEEKPEWIPDISVDTAFLSAYVWRGQTLTDAAVFEPSASISYKNSTASIWANQNLGGNGELSELDYIFDYTANIGDIEEYLTDSAESFLDVLNASLGFTVYTFPNLEDDDFDSYEPYIGLSADIPLKPFIIFYYDFDNGNGGYLEFGISHSVAAKDFDVDMGYFNGVSLDLGLTTGVNFGQWGYDESFTNVLFSWGLTVPFLKYFSVAPNFNYSFAADDQYDNKFYAGVILSAAY